MDANNHRRVATRLTNVGYWRINHVMLWLSTSRRNAANNNHNNNHNNTEKECRWYVTNCVTRCDQVCLCVLRGEVTTTPAAPSVSTTRNIAITELLNYPSWLFFPLLVLLVAVLLFILYFYLLLLLGFSFYSVYWSVLLYNYDWNSSALSIF